MNMLHFFSHHCSYYQLDALFLTNYSYVIQLYMINNRESLVAIILSNVHELTTSNQLTCLSRKQLHKFGQPIEKISVALHAVHYNTFTGCSETILEICWLQT